MKKVINPSKCNSCLSAGGGDCATCEPEILKREMFGLDTMTVFICNVCYDKPCELKRKTENPPQSCPYQLYSVSGIRLSKEAEWMEKQ